MVHTRPQCPRWEWMVHEYKIGIPIKKLSWFSYFWLQAVPGQHNPSFYPGACVCTRASNKEREPVSLTFFALNSNSMESSPCCNSVTGHQIATNFGTCHDSTAVVPCTKFCSDHCIEIEMRVKPNFHRIWIAMEKPLVKRGPGRNWSGMCARATALPDSKAPGANMGPI